MSRTAGCRLADVHKAGQLSWPATRADRGVYLGNASCALPDVDIATRFSVTLLDGFTLRSGDSSAPPSGEVTHGLQRLVAYLCLSGRPTRTAVAGRLWPDVPEEQAHASLRSTLWRL